MDDVSLIAAVNGSYREGRLDALKDVIDLLVLENDSLRFSSSPEDHIKREAAERMIGLLMAMRDNYEGTNT